MQRGVPDVETDWTRGEGQYVLALAYPLAAGGAVVARIDGAALREQLQGVTSTQRAVITLLDQQHRVVYRSQTPESAIGMDLSESGVRSALQSQNTAVIAVKSSIDGVERVYGLGTSRRNRLHGHGWCAERNSLCDSLATVNCLRVNWFISYLRHYDSSVY